MVGFSLAHIHAGFFIVGVLCAYTLVLWLIPALVYLILRRKQISGFDVAMLVAALFVVGVMATPDTLFASSR